MRSRQAAALVLSFALLATRAAVPVVNDPRLEITLVAKEPAIVTPIGIAADPAGRLFVLESHTHARPARYSGPALDRVKIFSPGSASGSQFATGIQLGLNLAFSPSNELFVCRANAITVVRKGGWLGRSTQRDIVTLDTKETYPHSRLLSLTFGPDGLLYFTRGNCGGHAWTVRGSDGSTLSGFGDGGNVMRCRPDGSAVREFATGFWNPADLKFDRAGRLFAVDNDPDARGPNRLLRVIENGDYGFRSRYGVGGRHVFSGWTGELPGTLPMASPLGEAPAGVLDCAKAALPSGYDDSLFVSSWLEHTIEHITLAPGGFSGERKAIVRGDAEFRPVALAAGPDGAIYITDWVLSSYPVHGHGRIWKLARKPGVSQATSAAPAVTPLEQLIASTQRETSVPTLLDRASHADAYVRSAAVASLARAAERPQLVQALKDSNPLKRLATLLALRRQSPEPPQGVLEQALRDDSEAMRMEALIWIAEENLSRLSNEISSAVSVRIPSPRLLRGYIACAALLAETPAQRTKPGFQRNDRDLLSSGVAAGIVADASVPPGLRALAITELRYVESSMPVLASLLDHTNAALQVEALRALAGQPDAAIDLTRLAFDETKPGALRAESIIGLGWQSVGALHGLVPLLDSPSPVVRREAARALRGTADDPFIRVKLEEHLATASSNDPAVPQLLMALGRRDPGAPQTREGWQQAGATGGDPRSGRRVFFSRQSGCSQCHLVHGRGAVLGPDLSEIGRGHSRAQLMRSVLDPSAEMAPEYQAYAVDTTDDESYTGLQGHFMAGGAIQLLQMDGRTITIPGKKVASYRPLQTSLMPEGLEHGMSAEDFRDLIAFLESLR